MKDKQAQRIIRALLKMVMCYSDLKFDSKDCTCNNCRVIGVAKRYLRKEPKP